VEPDGHQCTWEEPRSHIGRHDADAVQSSGGGQVHDDAECVPRGAGQIGDASQISVPEMRGDSQLQGVALKGIAAKKGENDFIVGLTKADGTIQKNVELLRDQAWLDVPFQLASGKLAKIALEKGVPGDQLMRQALAAWAK